MNIKQVFELLNKLPTVQARVLVTLVVWLGTAIACWAGFKLTVEFAGLIAVMSGADAAAYHSKRVTFKPDIVSIQNGNVQHDEVPTEEEKG